jgi:hypothetical protein
MKQVFKLVTILSLLMTLGGCLASSTSPDGINCGPSEEKPVWERPLVCQGR